MDLRQIAQKEAEADRDRDKNPYIQPFDVLWTQLGKDFGEGAKTIAVKWAVSPDELVDVLANQVLAEAQTGENFGRVHWSKLFLLVAAGILALSVWFVSLMVPKSTAMVAAHKLPSGKVLKTSDVLKSVTFDQGNNCFSPNQLVEGLIVLHDIPRGTPLRYGDVVRPEVTAAKDLPAGGAIGAKDLLIRTSAYDPDAAILTNEVVNRVAKHGFQKGEVILRDFLKPSVPHIKDRP